MKKLALAITAAACMATAAWAGDTVAYLGVVTAPLDPAVSEHLGLPDGVGLAVLDVAEDGVVKDLLHPRDILHKLDDQLLTSPDHLAVLVRAKKPGDEVAVSVFRKGKAETLKVTLGEVDRARVRSPGAWNEDTFLGPWFDRQQGMQAFEEAMRNWQRQMEQMQRRFGRGMQGWSQGWSAPDEEMMPNQPEAEEPPPPPRERPRRLLKPVPGAPAPEAHVEQHVEAMSTVSESRDGVTITLTDRNGQRSVRIEEEGKTVFDGPLNSDEQMKKVPEKYRERIAEMKDRVKVDIHTGGRPVRPWRPGMRNVL